MLDAWADLEDAARSAPWLERSHFRESIRRAAHRDHSADER